MSSHTFLDTMQIIDTGKLGVHWSHDGRQLVIDLTADTRLFMTPRDAERLADLINAKLSAARRMAKAEGTESGMTELDCALMRPAPQDARDHARVECPYPNECPGCRTKAESLAEAEKWKAATRGEALTDWERELLAQAEADDDGEDRPEDPDADRDRDIADDMGAL
ncbi:hypothetical protein [Nocardia concava]|uniref:hypothetical protein n=1 Tax=Nocardia concava TaxID=257281 RepID=UPI000306D5D6|nr:hypothetical protein [Nocardia concava]